MPKEASHKLTETFVNSQHPPESRREIRDSELTGFMLRLEPSGRKTYYMQFDRTHKRKVGNAEVLELKIARNKAKVMLGDFIAGTDKREQEKKVKRLNLREFLKDEYLSWAEVNMRQGKQTIERLLASCKPMLNIKLDRLTEKKVEDWKSSRLKLGRADTTVKREVTALKTALSRAKKWGFVESNPAIDVTVKIDSDLRVRYLKPDERKRLLNALEARDEKLRGERSKANEWRRVRGYKELPEITSFADYLHPLVLTVLNTGLRRSEALSLKWSNVDLDVHKQATVLAAHSKKRKTRRVQLNSFTVESLKVWKKQGRGKGHVFPNPANGLRLQRIDTAWRTLMKNAKLENFRFHDLRHDYASQLVMKGVDIYTVKEMMGHSTLDMTERYAHLDPKRLAEAAEVLV